MFTTVFLFVTGIVLVILSLRPLLEGEYEMKSFANLLYTLFILLFMLSFESVKRSHEFTVWASSFILLDLITIMFLYYDDILLG